MVYYTKYRRETNCPDGDRQMYKKDRTQVDKEVQDRNLCTASQFQNNFCGES